MTKVTDLPSGQRLVWPLETFTRSERVMTETELALLETSARSRAVASETLMARKDRRVELDGETHSLRQGGIGLRVIFAEIGRRLNGHEGHVP